MFWIETAVTVGVGFVALIALMLTRRPTANGKFGSVSRQWVVEHRVDSR